MENSSKESFRYFMLVKKPNQDPFLGIDKGEDEQGDILTKGDTKAKVKKPKRYKVLLHNDDYTTMEFVVFVLQSCFSKTLDEAQKVMLKVHNDGVGICGVYTYEIAETKTAKVIQMAKESGHPLKCTFEPE